MKCERIHELGGMKCIRKPGHDGYCRCKVEARHDIGTLTYAEWYYNDQGKFRHVGYTTIYPKNMRKEQPHAK